jgi:hypothetical protein
VRLPSPTVTAPSWEADPYGWCLWYLRENGRVYRAWRDAVDQRRARYPSARISADAALHHVRWSTPVNADGDLFQVNNNAGALFARVYIGDRRVPRDTFELRHSFLDDLTPAQKWELVRVAQASAEPVEEQPALLPGTERPAAGWRPL